MFTDINNVGKLCRKCHRQQPPQLAEYENLPLRVQLTAVLFSLPERPQPDLSQSVCLHEQTCLQTTSNHIQQMDKSRRIEETLRSKQAVL